MDFTSYVNPEINFDWGFFNFWGPGLVDDTLIVFLSNGTQMVKIFQVGSLGNVPFEWAGFNYLATQAGISINSTMQIVVKTSDLDPDVNITEAGFDNFRVVEGMSTSNISIIKPSVYPNPTTSIVHLKNVSPGTPYEVYDIHGKLLQKNSKSTIDLSSFKGNIFIIKINEYNLRVIKE